MTENKDALQIVSERYEKVKEEISILIKLKNELSALIEQIEQSQIKTEKHIEEVVENITGTMIKPERYTG